MAMAAASTSNTIHQARIFEHGSSSPRCHLGSPVYYHSRPPPSAAAAALRKSSCAAFLQSRGYQHEGLRRCSTAIDFLRPVSFSEGFDQAVSSSLIARSPGEARAGCRGVVSAVFERFTERAIKSIMLAQREAKLFGKKDVGTEQLLLGLIAEERNGEGFLGSGVTIDRAREAFKNLLQESNQTFVTSDKQASEIPFSTGSKRVFEAALEQSKKMGHNYITPEHIALALFTVDDGGATKILDKLGLKTQKLQAESIVRLQGELAKDGRTPPPAMSLPAKSGATAASSSKRPGRKEKGALNDFCVDLTLRASDGKIDPVIGRDSEVQRVVQILARRTKNNPILLGEPGVGKTAIAEGLAIRIASGNVPEFLTGKRVMSLDMGLLLAGAKERGELESRVTSLIEETRKAGNVILLIDEVHTLVGSGSVGGRGGNNGAGLDIANLLKPALARGELQCIGATTLDEHRKHIEKDKALARRFQPVIVNEPSQEDAVKILLGIRDRYEEYHKCRITQEAVDAAVYLSSRYIADRYLPDKAIDLIDEAGSRARIDAFKRRKEERVSILSKTPSEYWQAIRAVQAAQEAAFVPQSALGDSEYLIESAANTLPKAVDIDQESVSLPVNELMEGYALLLFVLRFLSFVFVCSSVIVGPSEIAAVTSMWSGIPIEQLTSDEQLKLINLEKLLQTRVVGQDDAVNAISRAVRRARVGLKDPSRPIAAMLFCGPTGVGKTELTKALAQHFFGAEDAMIRLDMSEYMERHTVSKLIGSPPGYVGYGEGGTLTEAVRKRPFTVILLDEIEKAHPDIFNMLLQIFEDGRLTDSQGRVVSFRNSLLIMTSNVGSSAIARGGSGKIGFSFAEGGDEDYTNLKGLVMDELKNFFRPELLNRIDEVVVFRSLEKAQVRAIVDMMLAETKERLAKRGINLEVSEAAVKLVCDEGYDKAYGARPLRRAVTRIIEDAVSESLLASHYSEGDTALLDLDASGNPVVVQHSKPDRCDHGLCVQVRAPVSVASS
ncbi:chaperone protein ClpD, chloroplastic isoform X1 [Selaginella moellendorffii]|uniref:chaperone protein ClpD, chloroplastic isoform X1 n=1 Tax=Selaginella moellendorffii TaxID=88036 RepID=UPI000D1C5B49|nr:chaperone protein ClpD, chloroplastic isoform X1 [Selaginella moellendorffii]|eukprot:XP_024532162.1 chaperone protein ClpD, chloroplastic isoform X1 [Selaginella moellendorffii]